MSEIHSKITAYKTQRTILGLILIIGAIYSLNADYPAGLKILIGLGAFITCMIMGIYYETCIGNIRCPNCGKPVLIKTAWYDANMTFSQAGEECYFCHHKFE